MVFLLTSPPPPSSLLHKNPNPTLLLHPTNLHSFSFFFLSKTPLQPASLPPTLSPTNPLPPTPSTTSLSTRGAM
ncbi:hypothetical protein CsSME_00006526 [Camellia sinensis var. sinensis]